VSAACQSRAAAASPEPSASNDPRDLDGRRLRSAMHRLGRDPALRGAMLALLRQAEGQLDYPGAVRDDVTGPIADAPARRRRPLPERRSPTARASTSCSGPRSRATS
jgi:hypothetical protein